MLHLTEALKDIRFGPWEAEEEAQFVQRHGGAQR